jgi:enoyl-CoA hydratase/carnithine racemase
MSIKTAVVDGVATIEIARPEKKNAITRAMYTQLAVAFDAAREDAAVRAVLLTGQPGHLHLGQRHRGLRPAPERRGAAVDHLHEGADRRATSR